MGIERTYRRVAISVLLIGCAVGESYAQPAPDETPRSQTVVKVEQLAPPVRFRSLTPEDGLPQQQVSAIAQDRVGFLWFGTQAGLARYDGREFLVYRHDSDDDKSLPDSEINALAIDGDGRLWIGTHKGLAVYDDASDSFKSFLTGDAGKAREVNALAVTEAGQLYASSDEGLFRIQDDNVNIVPDTGGNPVNALAPMKGGGIWFATDIGVEKIGADGARGDLKMDAFETLVAEEAASVEDAEQGVVVAALLHDSSGTLWVGTNHGVADIDPASGTVKNWFRPETGKLDSLSDPKVNVIVEDADKKIWIGTDSGLNLFKPETRGFTRFKAGEDEYNRSFPGTVYSIFTDATGSIWTGNVMGVRIYNPFAARFNAYSYRYATGVTTDAKSNVWTSAYFNGLRYFDREAGTWSSYTAIETVDGDVIDLTDYWLTAVLVAKDGSIWFSGDRGIGLVHFFPQKGVAELEADEIKPHRVNNMIEATDGRIWLSTFGAGVFRFDPKTRRLDNFGAATDSLTSDFVYIVKEDRKDPNIIWVGGYGGLDRISALDGQVVQHYAHDPEGPTSIGEKAVTYLYQEPSGGMWIGTYGSGLDYLAYGGTEFKHHTTKDGLPDDTVYGIVPDDAGALWLSTNGGGLVRFDPKSGEMRTFTTADGLVGNEFIQLSSARAPSGEIVFGAMAGFNIFHPEALRAKQPAAPVVFTGIKLFNNLVDAAPWLRKRFEFDYDAFVSVSFTSLSYSTRDELFSYRIKGLQSNWIETTNRSVPLSNMGGGDYTLEVRVADPLGEWGPPTSLTLTVIPPLWLTWWAYGTYVFLAGLAGIGVWRYQRGRLEALRQANRLASVERDLELTGTIQAGFLPKENPRQRPTTRLVGVYRPAGAAGGDWWWCEDGGPGQEILVGDVTGHGPGPAIVTASVATAYRVQTGAQVDLGAKLARINHEVLAAAQDKYLVVLSALGLAPDGSFEFWSAGGLPMLHLSRSRPDPLMVVARGTPLGSSDFKVGKTEGQLQPGDRCFLFTDGIFEQKMADGRELGMKRLVDLLSKDYDLPLDEAAEHLLSEIDRIREHQIQDDDYTIVMFEYQGS